MTESRIQRLLAYLIVPVVFCALGYLMLFIALRPIWTTASAVLGMLSAEDVPVFDDTLTSMYDPDAAPAAVQEVENGETYIHIEDVEFPTSGAQYGYLTCDRIGVSGPVYWFDSNDILRVGIGQSIASKPPGFGRMVLLSAHNTSFFLPLKDAAVGDVFRFDTNYCPYEYQVSETFVINEKELDKWLGERLLNDHELLVMYTCWPFDAYLGRKTDRWVVVAERISGEDVKWRNLDDE